MKLSTSILIASIAGASAFSPLPVAQRVSAVKPLNYGWDQYYQNQKAPAPPAPAAPAAPPAPVAPPAPPAAQAPPAPVVEEKKSGWDSTNKYDRSKDVFPTFPPHYRSFEEIYAEFQANKAAGRIK